jgi:hypothetical protein
MKNWLNINCTSLENIELIAEDNCMISSEEELSQLFDETFSNIDFGNDLGMIRETFNNWTDGLCKDGVIHDEQYNYYTYIGKHSE